MPVTATLSLTSVIILKIGRIAKVNPAIPKLKLSLIMLSDPEGNIKNAGFIVQAQTNTQAQRVILLSVI